MLDGRCGEVGCRLEVSSTAEEMEKPLSPDRSFRYRGTMGAEPETTTEGCALLECQSRSGIAQSGTPVHGQSGSCS